MEQQIKMYGMSNNRCIELERNQNLNLTKKEVNNGWCFCWELDFALANKNWEHIKTICNCRSNVIDNSFKARIKRTLKRFNKFMEGLGEGAAYAIHR